MGAPQTHHGMCVADLDATRAALRAVGFTATQPNAPEPLVYADEPDDPVGRLTCPTLGSPYRTHYVENPATGQQIDLIEVPAAFLEARPSAGPVEGDLVIGLAVDDPEARAAELSVDGWRVAHPDGVGLRWREGQLLVLTEGEPFAVVHYHPDGWRQSLPFFTETLGVRLDPIGEDRWQFTGIGGRLEVTVRDEIVRAPAGIGKRYPGANHFRLLDVSADGLEERVARTPGCSWLLPPADGFAFVAGPSNETVELFLV